MADGNTSTTTTTASISDLPELPLLTIFDYVPLPNLFHIDEVCRAWQKLKPEACSRRRHLIIANDQTNLDVLTQPAIVSECLLPQLDSKRNCSPDPELKKHPDLHALFIGRSRPLQVTLYKLLELMPNLTVFRLVQQHGSHEELSKVNQLLAHYRHQLVEVTIWFIGELTDGDQNRVETQLAFQQMFLLLMASLNRLTALRSLDVNFKPPPECPVVLDDRQRSIHCLPDVVGHLKRLKFRTRLELSSSIFRNNPAADARLLNQVLFRMRDGEGADKALAGEASKLKQQQPKKQKDLELYVNGTPLTLRTLVSLGPVAVGLRTVQIDGVFSGHSQAEYKALARLASLSPHLQKLTVNVRSLSIRRLVQSLASLKELASLYICCFPAPSSPPENVNIDQLPVLPSVKFLDLHFSANSHQDYEQLYLEVLFPNLTNVLWNHLGRGCSDCGYMIPQEEINHYQLDPNYLRRNASQFKADYGRPMQKCLRLGRMAAFSRLPQLAYLWVQVCPFGYVYIPFKDEVFTSHASLSRQTEFFLKENSPSYVVYSD